ncbi:MAG: hypothetical protein K9J17_08470 [Flavobacteriales bacterium]|nr:hypothetical protein [Flavobacteriales bacterium]
MIIKVRNSGLGIGDQITGLYACQALKEQNRSAAVEYYCRHPEWAVDVKDFSCLPYKEYIQSPPAEIDLYFDSATAEYKSIKKCRKHIYTDRLGIPGLVPVAPNLTRYYEGSTNRSVLLFPFAAWPYREWPIEKWLELEKRLLVANYDVMVLGVASKTDLLTRFRSMRKTGLPAEDIIALMLEASCIVANDSGMAHLGGMYKAPVVAITSVEFSRDHLFSMTNVKTASVPLNRLVPSPFFRRQTSLNDQQGMLNKVSVEQVFGLICSSINTTNKHQREKHDYLQISKTTS